MALVTAGSVALGLGVGFATAAVAQNRSAPASSAQIPQVAFERNASGLTFGSAADANSPAREPDLIRAKGTNGKTGYVLKEELDVANGSSFTSPEEALAWQESIEGKRIVVPVYAVDGETVIGEFELANN